VDVVVNQLVEANQTLIHIDPDVYALAVNQAEIDLALAGQNVGADTANVASAQANLTNARAELARAERDMQRVIPLEARGILQMAAGAGHVVAALIVFNLYRDRYWPDRTANSPKLA